MAAQSSHDEVEQPKSVDAPSPTDVTASTAIDSAAPAALPVESADREGLNANGPAPENTSIVGGGRVGVSEQEGDGATQFATVSSPADTWFQARRN